MLNYEFWTIPVCLLVCLSRSCIIGPYMAGDRGSGPAMREKGGGVIIGLYRPFLWRRQRELFVVEAPAGLADDALEIHYAVL